MDTNELLSHATTFEFGNDIHNTVSIHKVKNPNGDYWAIMWASNRWNKKDRLFIHNELPSNRTDEFIEETKFSLDEAIELVTTKDLLAEHKKRLTELISRTQGNITCQ